MSIYDADDLDWRADAACLTVDPEIFFPEEGNSSRRGKKVCRDCPAKTACLLFALEQGVDYGIWGGLNRDERRRLRRAA